MNVTISEGWNRYLDLFKPDQTDIYYTEEYVRLYETAADTALSVVCTEGDRVTLMPFLRRKIGAFYDFETAYGYGGPISNTDSEEWTGRSLDAIRDHMGANGYLCGFMRFHPLIGNAAMCRDKINVLYDRKTVCIDLTPSEEDIWAHQITSKNRNMIRKAEKSGLLFRAEYDYSSMDEFVGLYNSTMERLKAESFYFFDDKYFETYINNLSGKGFLGTVTLDNKIIGAALFMMHGEYGHYHLAGSNRDYSSLGINNFLLWNTAVEMKKHGISAFHLGGGTTSDPDDPLLKFKHSFSGNEKDFCIGKWIFNEEAYRDICAKWENEHPGLKPVFGNRLLKYRYTEEDL